MLGVFYTLAGTDTNEARNALMREFSPKLSAYGSEITMNRALFARIETLWQARDSLGLTGEEARVLELYRRMFVRAGALLEGADAERLKDVKSRLAVLSTQFTQNLLADERGWSRALSQDELEGLPDFVVASAKAAAEDKDLFIDFSGSDWCIWCQRLDGEVLSQEAFVEGATDDFVFVLLDFPRGPEARSRVEDPEGNLIEINSGLKDVE